MAQSGRIQVEVDVTATVRNLVDVDVAETRQRVKRVIREAEQVNRDLASLQERLGGLSARLSEYGIDLVIGDDA